MQILITSDPLIHEYTKNIFNLFYAIYLKNVL